MFLNDKDALISMCDISNWKSPIAMTLNFKQSIETPERGYIMIDETICNKEFRRYMRELNRLVYKNGYRRNKKRLRVAPALEKSEAGRWHYHIAIEPPRHMTPSEFGEMAMNLWLSTKLGYGYGKIELNADKSWIEYILKRRSKNGFEQYIDCLDIYAFHK